MLIPLSLLPACDESTKANNIEVHLFSVQMTGSQQDSWNEHLGPNDPGSCGGTYDEQGQQQANLGETDGSIVAVVYDPGSPEPITGTSDIATNVDISGQRSINASGPGCGGCDPEDPGCGAPIPSTCAADFGAPIGLRYDGSRVMVAPSSGEREAFNCPFSMLAPIAPDNSSAVTVAGGEVSTAQLTDIAQPVISTELTVRQDLKWDTGAQSTTLKLPIRLRRTASLVPGKKLQADDCKGAGAIISSWNPAGSTTWSIRFGSAPVSIQATPVGKTATATFKVSAPKQIVKLPVWTNIPDVAAVKAAWDSAQKALLDHEVGHVDITTKFVQGHSTVVITGSGSTQNDAMGDLAAKRDAKLDSLRAELQDQQDAYDVATQHGVKQSNIGGTNTILMCPLN